MASQALWGVDQPCSWNRIIGWPLTTGGQDTHTHTHASINSDLNKRRNMTLYFLKASGEFNAAVREWEQKPAAQKTWVNIKTFISSEYAKENKQNKHTAKKFSTNNINEQAKATEELIAALA